jgi:hypothetical protein
MRPVIRCGPMVRYVDTSTVVLWCELDRDCEIELELTPYVTWSFGAKASVRRRTVQVQGGFYVWLPSSLLSPDTWYRYELFSIENSSRTRLWPNPLLAGTSLPSAFRTLPLDTVLPVRICFGSCRAGIPPGDPNGLAEGQDALCAYAETMAAQAADSSDKWPRLFLFTGDQIYGDGPFSTGLTGAFRTTPGIKPSAPINFEQYAAIYREAWTATPLVRWALSCVPSFMICDDHEITDDWNISSDWVQAAQTPRWQRKLSDGLLAYWVYQGAGNLPPSSWLADARMRPLTPQFASTPTVATPELRGLFDRLTRGSARATWSYAIDVGDTRLVVGDTRMSRKLTGRRLLMDDQAWTQFVALAKDRRSRKVILIVPGPVLTPHPLHDLLSRAAQSIEGNPPSAVGAIIGGIAGGLIAGPPGIVVGAFAGAIGGEIALDRFMPGLIEFADAELWSAFPTSFNRMLSLLEDLADGKGTNAKQFISLIGGDVHHSYVIRGDLLRSRRPKSVLNLTMSPIRRAVKKNDTDLLKMLDGSTWYLDLARKLERPSFVDEQMRRLDWYPIRLDGSRPDASDVDEWACFGQFVGELDVSSFGVSYRYLSAEGASGVPLRELGRATVTTI